MWEQQLWMPLVMIRCYTILCILLCNAYCAAQKITFLDAQTQNPVSFATISFGDGLGTFANAEGEFTFDKKRYADVDSLFVSGMGYKPLALSTSSLQSQYEMEQNIDQLKEVVLVAPRTGKFKKKQQKPISHTDYFQSWLPTVESEVAVRFNEYNGQPTQISTLLLPVNTQEEFDGKKGRSRPFSTLLRVQFYDNNNNLPGNEIPYGNIVFVVTEDFDDDVFELDVEAYNIFIPDDGLFVSLQVLGHADEKGNLIESKKYNEIKTKQGIRKISITFRPLLPFTNEVSGEQTFVRRVFFNNKKWQPFNFKYNPNSKLLLEGYNNYAMGAKFHVYED